MNIVHKKKIKIVHFTSSLKMGGAEAVLCDLVHSLDHKTFEHAVIYIHDGPHRQCLQALGVPHYQIKYDPLFFINLMCSIQKIRPDIIHTLLSVANIMGRIAGKFLAIPVVSAWHNNLDQDGVIRNFFDRATYRLAARHIAVSQGVVESAERQGLKNSNRVSVITNGINTQKIRNLSEKAAIARSDLLLNSSHFIIGSVGRFMPVKRYDLMLDAFALLHRQFGHTRLVLVGIGEQEAALRTRATELGIACAVIFIVGQESAGYYPLFDCFSLSSDKEGISIALLEAMSFGLPCVVTHSDGHHAVIEQGVNGLFVSAGDAYKLAQAWRLLIENKELACAIGLAAYSRVQSRFSSERMCLEYEAVFKKVVNL